MKRYIPSENEVFDLLKDSEVGDKEYWKKEIVFLEVLQRSRKISEQRNEQFHKRQRRIYFIVGFILVIFVSVLILRLIF